MIQRVDALKHGKPAILFLDPKRMAGNLTDEELDSDARNLAQESWNLFLETEFETLHRDDGARSKSRR